jgi:ADP-heptose:LPS heptosyltransferase
MFTNDSGPLHLAVALGTPTISIFGPTSPGATGPYGAGHACVQHDLFCVPCFKKRCPYDLECLKELPVSEVLEAWRGLNSKGK